MNRDISANGGDILKPRKDNDGRDTDLSKTSSRQGVRDDVEKFLSVNGEAHSRFLLGGEFLSSKSDAQECMLRLTIRNTSNRAKVDVGTCVRAKDEQGFGPNAVGNRRNRKRSQVFESQFTTLFWDKSNFNVEPGFREGGSSKNVMEKLCNGVDSREREGFKVSNTDTVEASGFFGGRPSNDLSNNLSEIIKSESIRKNVSSNNLGVGQSIFIPRIIELIIKGVGGLMHFSKTDGGRGTVILTHFDGVGKSKGRFLDPFSNSAGPNIWSSSELKTPVFDRSLLLFINSQKNLRCKRIGFLTKCTLEVREGFRKRVGISDPENRMVSSRGTFIGVIPIDSSAPNKPMGSNGVIGKAKVRHRVGNTYFGRERDFKLSSSRIFKVKNSTNGRMS